MSKICFDVISLFPTSFKVLKDMGVISRAIKKNLIEGSIYLELFVKVMPNWRKKESKLIEYGYEEDF